MGVMPAVSTVTGEIRRGRCDWCVDMPQNTRSQPEELWLPNLSVWVRADGSAYHGDQGRGFVYPGGLGRIAIRNAVCHFRARAQAPQ